MDLKDILPEVLPSTPGCPRVVAVNAIRNAIREFCEGSHAWLEWIDDVVPVAGERSYTVSGVPAGAEILALADMDGEGAPYRAVFMPPDRIMFHVEPSAPVKLRMALKPTPDATEIPDGFGSSWRSAFADGALYRLFRMPNVEWSDPNLAGAHHKIFYEEMTRAKVEQARGYGHGEMRVNVRGFV